MIRTPQELTTTMCQNVATGSIESTGGTAPFGDGVDCWLDEIVLRDEFEEDDEFEDDDEADDDEEDDDWEDGDDDDDWDDDDEEEEDDDDDEDMIAAPSKGRRFSTRN